VIGGDRAIEVGSHRFFWHASISGSTEILQVKYAPNVPLSQNHPEEVQQAFFREN